MTADRARLVQELRERADFEDRRVLEQAKADGFEPLVYSGSRTGALLIQAADAIEALAAAEGDEDG